MPVLVLFALALTVGAIVGVLVWRYPRIATPQLTPTLDTAEKVGETVARHPRLRALLKARLDPNVATGLALTLALVLVIGGGVLFGALAYLVRTNAHLAGIDNGVAKWGNRHASGTSTSLLGDVTQFGSIYVVVVACVVLAVVETVREKTVWVVPFIVSIMAGEEALMLTVKGLVGRLRPTFNPAAATLGPSFPSGHSATAAAFYATAALLLGRGRARPARAVLTGLAAGIAVGVAASRVLLDVHWLTDVIAGLSLGWAWFAVCAIAFGGRILRFGAAAETAARVAGSEPRLRASPSSRGAAPGRERPGTRRGARGDADVRAR
jgi:membrane-associated phospholipid phosphatase